MGYIKPERFFRIYSGQNIDEIRAWIEKELHLSLTDVDWIAFRPGHHVGNNEMRVEAEIITITGDKYTTHTQVTSEITYHGEQE